MQASIDFFPFSRCSPTGEHVRDALRSLQLTIHYNQKYIADVKVFVGMGPKILSQHIHKKVGDICEIKNTWNEDESLHMRD